MYGTLIGTILYIIGRLFGAFQTGFKFMLPTTGILHADVAQMGWLIIPRMMALGALQLQLLLIDRLGSGLGKRSGRHQSVCQQLNPLFPVLPASPSRNRFSPLLGGRMPKAKKQFWNYVQKDLDELWPHHSRRHCDGSAHLCCRMDAAFASRLSAAFSGSAHDLRTRCAV